MENNNEEKNKHDVMVSNLPLLFSNGNPTSLEEMSAEDLQCFVPFLMKCILGVEPSHWAKTPRLKWWPVDIPWSPIILSKKYQTEFWGKKLQHLVKRCYDYNGCKYLLHFSAKLQQMKGGFKYTDNWDGTTSMYDSTSGKLLVTFRNENMVYDRLFRQQSCASRPMLLPRLNSPNSPVKSVNPSNPLPSEPPSNAQMVEPPVCDIFLCDYCGADFDTLSAIKAHEVQCMNNKAQESYATVSLADVETKDLDQAKFLWYLNLARRNQTCPPTNVTPAKVYPVSKKALTLSDRRYTTIQFSSNLGQSFFKMSKLSLTTSESLVDRYERHCLAKPRTGRGPFRSAQLTPMSESINSTPNSSWPVSFRRFNGQKRKEEWAHIYCFNRRERKERLKTIATGLTQRSRHLLRQCRPVNVVLKRLRPETIDYWTRPKPKQPLIQPWLQRSIAMLPTNCTISIAPPQPSTGLSLTHRRMSPSLVITRPGGDPFPLQSKPTMFTKPRPRSPPGLLPLITSAWSMRTMETVQPKNNSLFILPDLIPVNRNGKPRPPDPVIINMPPLTTLKPVAPQASKPVTNVLVVDLCSPTEADESRPQNVAHEAIEANLPPSFVIPPGISITKVDPKFANGSSSHQIRRSSHHRSEPNNNNGTKPVPPLAKMAPNRASGEPPALKFMGPNSRINILKSESPKMASGKVPITPLRLAKLPAAKREQMKQSLLKIQRKEGKSPNKSPSSATVGVSPSPSSNLSASSPSSTRDLTNILSDECKELKKKGLSDLLHAGQRITRRKRTKEEENQSPIEVCVDLEPSPKMAKIETEEATATTDQPAAGEDGDDGEEYSTVIEVDLAGPENSGRDSSRDGSCRSMTPDNPGRRRTRCAGEISRLLSDECKELRRKGLEHLTHSDQRVTRCRTKSAPVAANLNAN